MCLWWGRASALSLETDRILVGVLGLRTASVKLWPPQQQQQQQRRRHEGAISHSRRGFLQQPKQESFGCGGASVALLYTDTVRKNAHTRQGYGISLANSQSRPLSFVCVSLSRLGWLSTGRSFAKALLSPSIELASSVPRWSARSSAQQRRQPESGWSRAHTEVKGARVVQANCWSVCLCECAKVGE